MKTEFLLARPASERVTHFCTRSAPQRGPRARPTDMIEAQHGETHARWLFCKRAPVLYPIHETHSSTISPSHNVCIYHPSLIPISVSLGPWPELTEAAACSAKRQRARTSSAPTSTTMTLYVQHATDRGNKRHDWCRTETWSCTTAGFCHGDANAGEMSSPALQLLPSLHY